MMTLTSNPGSLLAGERPVVTGMPARWVVEPDHRGVFLVAAAAPDQAVVSRLAIPLGQIPAVARWTALYRNRPFWMFPAAGSVSDPFPRYEIQHLLILRSDGLYLQVVPLAHGCLRWSLEGRPDGLWLVGETGDPFVAAAGGLAAFVAVGDCPYDLWARSAPAVAERLGTCSLRRQKHLPAFVDDFGWCTWDAFYEQVSAELVERGLSTWAASGLQPRVLILDDGWQQTACSPTGERRLIGLGTNDKFPGGLAPLVRAAKAVHGVRTVLVWHAVIGSWGGVDGVALPEYGVRDVGRRFSPGLYREYPDLDDWWGHLVGVVPPSGIQRFYDDYHGRLLLMGIDGVKVDNQAVLEGVCTGIGDRVNTTLAYREALEASVERYFDGQLINCMSHATETWYQSRHSSLIRTSTDFWPKRPESHGLHLYTNAQVCGWFGEFMHGDWDMFQSDHVMGAYHAAGRAVSGSPVYCSDTPGSHDVGVLRRLVCSDGTVLRFSEPGRPGRSCLMHDPTHEDIPLTIVNRSMYGAAIGVFHARYETDPARRSPLRVAISAREVPGLPEADHLLWRHVAGTACHLAVGRSVDVVVDHAAYEICTLVPIDEDRAIVGPRERYVPILAIRSAHWHADRLEAVIHDGGSIVLWGRRPRLAMVEGGPIPIAWDEDTRISMCVLPPGGTRSLLVIW